MKSAGGGLHAVFANADAAVQAAIAGHLALSEVFWHESRSVRVRMALHSGVPEQRGGDYFGPVLNRAARLVAVAHPGQMLCSQATADLVGDALPASVGLALGRHQLRDRTRPEVVFR